MTEQFLFTVNHSVMNLSFYLRISPQSNHWTQLWYITSSNKTHIIKSVSYKQTSI
jgi:hypothetical protein